MAGPPPGALGAGDRRGALPLPQQLLKWLEQEEEIAASPMARMRPPTVPAEPVPVLSDNELAALLKACEGKDLEERRDTMLIRTLLDTGGRLSEVSGLAADDVDFTHDVILVVGKGRAPRLPLRPAGRPSPLTATSACAPATLGPLSAGSGSAARAA